MRGKLVDLALGLNGRQRVTVELAGDFRSDYEKLKDAELDVEIKKHRQRRSLNANSYFHLLCGKIAEAKGLGLEEVKRMMVTEYGAFLRDADGNKVGFKLPVSVDVNTLFAYVKWFDEREENGVRFNCYLAFKPTHLMDTKEMARLIDGTIKEARDLGLETDTPEQLARYKEYWAAHE